MDNLGLPANDLEAQRVSIGSRVVSIDVGRGLTVLLMIFLGALSGAPGAPSWLEHVRSPLTDSMTIKDLPIFWFAVGMVIPLALDRRGARTGPTPALWSRVLTRTLALLGMGVFLDNAAFEEMQALGWPKGLWSALVFLAIFMTMNRGWTVRGGRFAARALRATGVICLIWLALVYQGMDGLGFQVRTAQWEPLGLIGWSYLLASAIGVGLGFDRPRLVAMMGILLSVYIADRHGFFGGPAMRRWIDIGEAFGTLPAVTLSGVVVGTLLLPGSTVRTPLARIQWALNFGLGMAIAAILFHRAYGINKLEATPSWGLWSSAVACWLWALLYWALDDRGWTRGTGWLQRLGQNALVAFLLWQFLIVLANLLGFPPLFELPGLDRLPGFVACALYTAAVVGLAITLPRVGLRVGV